jgi:hypothetical protein
MASNAMKTTLLTTLAYLCFYTAYDKQKKKIVPNNLLKVVLFENGVDGTLVEYNKAISLSGLTLLCFAFIIPRTFEVKNPAHYQNTLYFHAEVMLAIHSFYSVFKYYGSKNIPKLNEWKVPFWTDLKQKKSQMEGIKKLSIILGDVSQLMLFFGYNSFFSINRNFALVVAIVVGTMHFYLMEIDYKFALQVRPFAFLPFPLAAAVVVLYFWKIPHL